MGAFINLNSSIAARKRGEIRLSLVSCIYVDRLLKDSEALLAYLSSSHIAILLLTATERCAMRPPRNRV